MITLFSFWVLSSAATGIFSLGVGKRYESEMRAYAVARSAVPYVQKILEDDETPKHDIEGEAIFCSLAEHAIQKVQDDGEFKLTYQTKNPVTGYPETQSGITDEESKLNLNTVTTDILSRLIDSLVTFKEKGQMESLVASITDWRDEDHDAQKGGAEKYDYLALKKPYDCKNGSFESLEELLLVKGMTPLIYQKISPYLTVFGSGKVNINTATAATLLALGITDSGVSGITAFRRGDDGELGTEDDRAIKNANAIAPELNPYLLSHDSIRIAQLVKDDLLDVRSEAFRFKSEGVLEDDSQPYQMDIVMKRDGEILAWQEY